MANEVDYSPHQYKGNGLTRDFPFDWKLIKTDEIVVELELVSTGNIRKLNIGSDYNVEINEVGGKVTLTTAPSSDYFVNISRNTSQYQSKGYSTSTGFQGSEIEKSFDQVSCNLQEMDYKIKVFQKDVNSSVEDINKTAQESLQTSNQALDTAKKADTNSNNAIETSNKALSKAEEALENSNTAKQQSTEAVNTANTASQTADNAKQQSQETEERVDKFEADIENVLEASQKINDFENSIDEVKSLAKDVESKAQDVAEKTEEVLAVADNMANKDLSNLTETANEILKSLFIPDYQKMINIGWEGDWYGASSALNKTYIAPSAGWINIVYQTPANIAGNSSRIFINNIVQDIDIRANTSGVQVCYSWTYLVNKGDNIAISNDLNDGTSKYGHIIYSKFIPIKGV